MYNVPLFFLNQFSLTFLYQFSFQTNEPDPDDEQYTTTSGYYIPPHMSPHLFPQLSQSPQPSKYISVDSYQKR